MTLKRALSLSVAADDMALPAPRPTPYWHTLADIAYAIVAIDALDETDALLTPVVIERRRVATERALASAHLDLTRRGEAITYATPAPSPFVATTSDRKIKRGKKGATVTVTRRGRVLVVGDSSALDDQDTRNGRVPRVVIAHAIDALRGHNRLGHVDGDALARLTSALYDIPDLIGTDHYSWSEATPEIPIADVASLVTHTCGITAGIAPAVDSALMPTTWARAPRPTRQHVTRRRVNAPRKRKSDPAPRENVVLGDPALCPWRAWFLVTELPAGADDAGAMFIGHRRVTRGENVRTTRRATFRDSFVIARDAVLPDALASLASVVQSDGAGKYRWRVVDTDTAGTITVDKRGRVSITGAGYAIRQCATIDALRKRLASV